MKKKITVCLFIFLISIFFSSFLIEAAEGPELMSLDFKGMDIRDVMKILAQKSGLNIVVDSDVKGVVTLYLKDVGVMDALNMVVSTNSLAYEQNGSIIRIMTNREYELNNGKLFRDKTKTEIIKLNYANAVDISKMLSQMKTSMGRIIADEASNTIVIIDIPEQIERMRRTVSETDIFLTTEIFSLEYATVSLLKDKLEQMVSKGIGSVRFDDRTNKLVIRDTPEKMEEIRRVLKAFDEKNREVLIEANIIQITLSDKYSYGIDWSDIAEMGDVRITGDTNIGTGLSNVTPSTLTVATVGGNYRTILSLLNTYGKTDVLSKPRITVLDKQEAKILVGAKEVYVTSEVTTTEGGTYHTTDNVQFVDVGVTLNVVPQINRDGFITLKIKPAVSNSDATKTVILKNPDGSTRTVVPYVTTSEAETTVVVKDKSTIIIGGLMKDTIVDNKEKVPFLGDIPVLGKLFSTTGKTKEKTELVILLTPHIIEGDAVSEEVNKYIDYRDKTLEKAKIEKPEEPAPKPVESRKETKEKVVEKELAKSRPVQPVKLKPKPVEKPKKELVKPEASKLKSKPKPEEKPKVKPAVKSAKKPEAEKKIETDKKAELEKKKKLEADKRTESQKRKKIEREKKAKPQEWAPLFGGAKAERVEEIEAGEEPVPAPAAVSRAAEYGGTLYEDYLSLVSRYINTVTSQQDVSGLKGDVELQFTIDKKGFLTKGPIVLNNPDLRLVRNAVSSVKKASPFPSFPKGLKGEEAEFKVTVSYK